MRPRSTRLRRQPAAPAPPCSSRAVLDDVLARSATAFAARDAALDLKLLQQAFDRATADGCVLERAEALRRLALADNFALRYDEARQKLDEAVSVFRQFGIARGEAQALTQIGFTLHRQRPQERSGTRRSARALDLARTIGDPQLLISIYENLAYAVEPGPEKDRLREEALALVRSTPDARATECSLLHQWGDEQFVLGRYDAAFRTITDAAACFERGRRPEPPRARLCEPRACLSRARPSRSGARAVRPRALACSRPPAIGWRPCNRSTRSPSPTATWVATTKALARLNEALDLARKLRIGAERRLLRGNIAGIYNALGRYKEAAATLEETLASPSAREPAAAADAAHRPPTSVWVSRRARSRPPNRRSRLSKGMPPDDVAMALSSRAWALQALGRFEAASADLNGAMAAVEDLRVHTVADDFLKRGFGQRYQWVFAASISLLQAQGRAREASKPRSARGRARFSISWRAGSAQASATTDAPRRGARDVPQMVAAAARLRSTVVAYWVSDTETFVWVVSPDGRLASARIGVTAGRARRRWCGTRPAPAGASPGLLVGAGSGARPWRALYRLLLGPVRAAPARSARAAGSPSCRTVRSSACRSPRCATRPIGIWSSPTTSTTSRRSGRCRTCRGHRSRTPGDGPARRRSESGRGP